MLVTNLIEKSNVPFSIKNCPIYLKSSDNIYAAFKLLLEIKMDQLPVFENEKCIGIVSIFIVGKAILEEHITELNHRYILIKATNISLTKLKYLSEKAMTIGQPLKRKEALEKCMNIIEDTRVYLRTSPSKHD